MDHSDGVDRSFAAFKESYIDGGAEHRVALDLDVEQFTKDHDGLTPFIIVRYGKYTAVINPMPLTNYLDVDVHPFVNGEDGAVAVMGMNVGRRVGGFREGDTPHRSNGWPAVNMAALFIGDVTNAE